MNYPSFNKEHLSDLIQYFHNLRNELINEQNWNEEKYWKWRGEILPFLGSEETRGRHLLYYMPLITNLINSKNPITKKYIKTVILNIIDKEFSQRLREIEQNGGDHEKIHVL